MMKQKQWIDAVMLLLLPLLMTYELIGQATHEYLGLTMTALLIAHHLLNRSWHQHLFKGKYPRQRIVMTALDVLLLMLLAVQAVSGIMMAKHALSFLPHVGRRSIARTLHMAGAYWSFVLMSLHAGMHLLPLLHRMQRQPAYLYLCTFALLLALYGVFAFFKQQLPGYMFFQLQFAFFDFDEPLAFFLLDYLAMMLLFMGCGAWLQSLMQKRKRSA